MPKTVNLVCSHCAKEYTLAKNRYQAKVKKGNKSFYCSKECYIEQSKSHIKPNQVCLVCQTDFYRPIKQLETSGNAFCSSSCAAKWNNRGRQRNPARPRTCSKCSKTFYRKGDERSFLCEDCRFDGKKGIKNRTLKECMDELSVKGKHPSWKTVYVRLHNNATNANLKKLPCQFCGYSIHIELAHIKPVRSFPDDATLEEINASDNILVLCSNHHWEFDNGILPLEKIPARVTDC
jgi:hypothetical protein